MTTLFVNACLRGESSRTLTLCREYLEGREGVREHNLERLALAPYDKEMVAYRTQLVHARVLDDAVFELAHDFAEADEIVIGAPYWDLSFPSALKVYIEHVSACDVTFHYTDGSKCEGLCRAKRLSYITTCGGKLGDNLGFRYLRGIAGMFGIPETRFAAAEDLDVEGINVEGQMDKARAVITAWRAAEGR